MSNGTAGTIPKDEDATTGLTDLGLCLVTSVAFFLVQFDGAALNTSLYYLHNALMIPLPSVQWFANTYNILFGCLLIFSGTLVDRYGPQKVFCTGMSILVLASIGCCVCDSVQMLIALRGMQGAGAALTVPSSLAAISRLTMNKPQQRTRILSYWAAAGGLALASAPILGAELITCFGWRSIFVFIAVIAILSVIAAAPVMRSYQGVANPERPKSLDSQMLTAAMLAAVSILVSQSTQWSALADFGACGAIAASGLILIRKERRSPSPVFPRSIVGNPGFWAAAVCGMTVNFTAYGYVFALAIYYQSVVGLSIQQTGLAFVPFALMTTLGNLIGGRLASACGTRLVIRCALAMMSFGYLALYFRASVADYTASLPEQVLIRLGVGVCVPATTAAMLGGVGRSVFGTASGIMTALRQAAGTIGVALAGVLVAADVRLGTDRVILLWGLVSFVALIAYLVFEQQAKRQTLSETPLNAELKGPSESVGFREMDGPQSNNLLR